jgi:hypothetical protein
MDKYYKKNLHDLQKFRSSLSFSKDDQEAEIIKKVSISVKEWLTSYMKKYEAEIEQKIKGNEQSMSVIQNGIVQDIEKISKQLLDQVEIQVKKLEKPLEQNIINNLSKINSNFLTELLETQKKLSDHISKQQNLFAHNVKQDFDDLETKLLEKINNSSLLNEFDKFKSEIYTQISEIQLQRKYLNEKETIPILLITDNEITEYMLLESTGLLSECRELIVQPSSFKSKTVVGSYTSQNTLDNHIYQNILLLSDINDNINIGDLITTSHTPGVCQKQEEDIILSTTVGKLISQVNWLNMKEIDGVYFNFGIGLCKFF